VRYLAEPQPAGGNGQSHKREPAELEQVTATRRMMLQAYQRAAFATGHIARALAYSSRDALHMLTDPKLPWAERGRLSKRCQEEGLVVAQMLASLTRLAMVLEGRDVKGPKAKWDNWRAGALPLQADAVSLQAADTLPDLDGEVP